MFFEKNFIKRLFEALEDQKWSKKKMAEAMKCSLRSIDQYKYTGTLPKLVFLKNLSKSLPNLNIHWLITGEGVKYFANDPKETITISFRKATKDCEENLEKTKEVLNLRMEQIDVLEEKVKKLNKELVLVKKINKKLQ